MKIIARSEFEKIEYEMEELSPAESIREAKVYIQNLNYDQAITLLEPIANRNNSEALYLLGTLYFNGTGVTTDVAKAADLFAKAAPGLAAFLLFGCQCNATSASSKRPARVI